MWDPVWSSLWGEGALSQHGVRLDCGWDSIITQQCLLYPVGQEGKYFTDTIPVPQLPEIPVSSAVSDLAGLLRSILEPDF